jgi:hypothetical protein
MNPTSFVDTANVLQPAWTFTKALVVGLSVASQFLLALYASHRYWTVWRWWRGRASRARPTPAPPSTWPAVTVQLPVYNERRVVERLIEAAGRLDYPAHRLEIQVLDDSTDETGSLAAAAVARLRDRGIDARHLRRDGRRGFKAGALAAGLEQARGEFLAVFDADFVPRPDFLVRLIPHFHDPNVGMVQARWGHLNRDRSLLTSAQAVMLDAHFLLEHAARMERRLFFNFNGSAGVWRRRCIEDAGGWSGDTLTEDLDLSYRAQLAGWRFVFDPTVVAPAELPGDAQGLRSQQSRWTKGSIQTALKLLPRLLRERWPWPVKVEAAFHLTCNACYPLLLTIGLLSGPVLVWMPAASRGDAWLLQAAWLVFGVAPVALFMVAGQRAAGVRGWRIARDVPAALVLGIGLAVNNARAVVAALGREVGAWERTPKSGDSSPGTRLPAYAAARRPDGWAELLLSAYLMGLVAVAWSLAAYASIPFASLLIAGFLFVALSSMRAAADRRVSAGLPRR